MTVSPLSVDTPAVRRAMSSLTDKLGKVSDSPLRYLFPFVAIGLAVTIQAALRALLFTKEGFPYAFLYLIAVFVTAWLGGYIPGIMACLLPMVALPLLAAAGFQLDHLDRIRS